MYAPSTPKAESMADLPIVANITMETSLMPRAKPSTTSPKSAKGTAKAKAVETRLSNTRNPVPNRTIGADGQVTESPRYSNNLQFTIPKSSYKFISLLTAANVAKLVAKSSNPVQFIEDVDYVLTSTREIEANDDLDIPAGTRAIYKPKREGFSTSLLSK